MEISDYKIVKIKLVKTVTIKLVVLRNEIEKKAEEINPHYAAAAATLLQSSPTL